MGTFKVIVEIPVVVGASFRGVRALMTEDSKWRWPLEIQLLDPSCKVADSFLVGPWIVQR